MIFWRADRKWDLEYKFNKIMGSEAEKLKDIIKV